MQSFLVEMARKEQRGVRTGQIDDGANTRTVTCRVPADSLARLPVSWEFGCAASLARLSWNQASSQVCWDLYFLDVQTGNMKSMKMAKKISN